MPVRSPWGTLLLILAAGRPLIAHGANDNEPEFSCQKSEDCASISELSGRAMECIDGWCQNPFLAGGCLQQRLPGWKRLRVCNSEDPPRAEAMGYCRPPPLAYEEVRILAQNWESANFASWILQILLNEMLDVPATIETGAEDKVINFYDYQSRFEYGTANDWEALKLSNEINCRQHANNPLNSFQPCAHLILEVWASNHQEKLQQLVDEGAIEHPTGLGALGEMGWYLPKFAAQKDPSFLSYLGMSKEENRRKLAEAFLTPASWKDYCQEVSNTSCAVPDAVAQRAPKDESEYDRMFAQDEYTGYFRKAYQNDCDINPNCTAHFADYPCDWGSYFEAQAYHLDIAASSPRYTYGQLVDIIRAGNATQSNFMLYWWTPEALLQSFRGSDTEMIRIGLPSTTQACLNSRISPTERCLPEVVNSHPDIRFGDPKGACDEAPQNLAKVVSTSLRKSAMEAIEVERSPAYDAINNFRINDLNFADFVESWFVGNQDPREAACGWLVNNFDLVKNFMPNNYPRILREAPILYPLFYTAVALGMIALVLGVGAAFLVAKRRNDVVMVYAQVDFLFLLLAGGILVALGSLINLLETTDATCVTVVWLVANGYTLLLVPLIVKVAAMNKVMRAARKFRRVVLDRTQLFGAVAAIEALVVMYLTLWTIFDAPRKQAQYELTDSQTDVGEYVVYVGYYCASNSRGWMIGSVSWNFLLIVCATIFAFATRTFESQFRETQTLAFMIYSHFIFAVMRFLVVLWDSDRADLRLVQSVVYGVDIAATVVIYFIPKFLAKPISLSESYTRQNSLMMSKRAPGPHLLVTTASGRRLQVHTLNTTTMNGHELLLNATHTVCCNCGENPFKGQSAISEEDMEGGGTEVDVMTGAYSSDLSNKDQSPETDGMIDGSTDRTSDGARKEGCQCCSPKNGHPIPTEEEKRISWQSGCSFRDEGLDREIKVKPKRDAPRGEKVRKTWHPDQLERQLSMIERESEVAS